MHGQQQRCLPFGFLFGFRSKKRNTTNTVRPSNKVRSITVAEFNASMEVSTGGMFGCIVDDPELIARTSTLSIYLRQAELAAAEEASRKEKLLRDQRAEAASLDVGRGSPAQQTGTADNPQDPDHRAADASSKHRREDRDPNQRITTMGTDSVRLRSPRADGQESSQRSSKKKHKSDRDRERVVKADRREPVVRSPRQSPTAVGQPAPSAQGEQEDSDQPVSTLRRDASATRLTAVRSNSIVRNSTSLGAISSLAGANTGATVTLESLAHSVHNSLDRDTSTPSGKQRTPRREGLAPEEQQLRTTSRKGGETAEAAQNRSATSSPHGHDGDGTTRNGGRNGKIRSSEKEDTSALEERPSNTNIEYLPAGGGGSSRSRDKSRKSTRGGGDAGPVLNQDLPPTEPVTPGVGSTPVATVDPYGRKRTARTGRTSPAAASSALVVEAGVLSASGPLSLDRTTGAGAEGSTRQRGARIEAQARTQRGRAGAEEASESCVIS
jgi:hypothetical protein